MSNFKTIHMVKEFPIGEPATSRPELLSKAEIVAFMARFQEQFATIENSEEREAAVRQYLSDLISLQPGEEIPSLIAAERVLNISSGFMQDYSKTQMIREANAAFFTEIYDLIANNMDLSKDQFKTR